MTGKKKCANFGGKCHRPPISTYSSLAPCCTTSELIEYHGRESGSPSNSSLEHMDFVYLLMPTTMNPYVKAKNGTILLLSFSGS